MIAFVGMTELTCSVLRFKLLLPFAVNFCVWSPRYEDARGVAGYLSLPRQGGLIKLRIGSDH